MKLFIIIYLLIFIGCSQKKSLTFITGGTPKSFAFWEKTILDFKEETGIDIQMIRSATQTEVRKQQIFIALRGQKADPDVMVMDIAWIGQLSASGWLEPLNDYKIDTSIFFNNIISLADIHDNSIIGLPLFVDAGLLYYRKDLLEKYGYSTPPETWQQFSDMAVHIQKEERKHNPDFWGFVWQGAQYEGLICNALEFFGSAGGGFYNNDNIPIIDSDKNIRALRFMADCINKEKISPPNTYTDMKEEETRLVFHNGNALFQRNWPYAGNRHNEEDSPVKGLFGISALPHFPEGKSVSTLGGWHVGISKHSDRKKDAAAFVKYITSYEVQKGMAVELGLNPGRKDVYESKELKSGFFGSLKKVFLTAVPRPAVPYYTQISLVLQKYINDAIAGNQNPDEALRKAQEEIEEIIKTYEN